MEKTSGIWSLDDAKKYHVHAPALAKWLCENLNKRYIVHDFGCGIGYYVNELCKDGFDAWGYEGTPLIELIALDKNRVIEYDITKPIKTPKQGNVLCIEVMEHIPPSLEESVLKNLANFCDDDIGQLILSWAIPGQQGHGHINCRDIDYVIKRLGQHAFACDWEAATRLRMIAPGVNPALQFFQNTLYVFRR